jgi:hypothetical protein
LFLGLLAAGCGSGGGSESVSRKEFAHQANAICSKVNGKAASELQKAYKSPPLNHVKTEAEGIRGEVTILVPILITEAERVSRDIGNLGVPDGEETLVNSMLGAYDAWIKKAKATPLRVVVANDIFNHARELTGKYGLSECGLTPYQVG